MMVKSSKNLLAHGDRFHAACRPVKAVIGCRLRKPRVMGEVE